MITLATAAYAHHSEVNAYRLNCITTRRIARFAAPNSTIVLIFEKNSVDHFLPYEHYSCPEENQRSEDGRFLLAGLICSGKENIDHDECEAPEKNAEIVAHGEKPILESRMDQSSC